MRDRARERLVRVAVAQNQLTAGLLRDQLLQAGIRALVRDSYAGNIIAGGIGGVAYTTEVLVLEGDADLAAAVLGAPPPMESLPPLALPAPVAPDAQVRRRRRRRWW